LDAAPAETRAARDAALDDHVKQVRSKVRELGAKAYWNRFDRAPEMVVMFIASEAGRGQSPAGRGRAPRDPRGGHPAHAAVHLHRLALRRGRRSGLRCRPGRARRRHDNQSHLPLRPPATPARRDRAPPPVGDARISRGR
jgi:hypothetical protein